MMKNIRGVVLGKLAPLSSFESPLQCNFYCIFIDNSLENPDGAVLDSSLFFLKIDF